VDFVSKVRASRAVLGRSDDLQEIEECDEQQFDNLTPAALDYERDKSQFGFGGVVRVSNASYRQSTQFQMRETEFQQ
jgi:hypothetical protein